MMRPLLPPCLLASLCRCGLLDERQRIHARALLVAGRRGLVRTRRRASRARMLPAVRRRRDGTPPSLYSDQRIAKVGDIVRVMISINDKATLGNATGRSQTTKDGIVVDSAQQRLVVIVVQPARQASRRPQLLGLNSGQGNIDRSEQIQVSVAAVVTRVLPNGNLVISRIAGSARQFRAAPADRRGHRPARRHLAEQHHCLRQDRRGAHLLRRPRTPDEVQQPAWGQQIYDTVRPF